MIEIFVLLTWIGQVGPVSKTKNDEYKSLIGTNFAVCKNNINLPLNSHDFVDVCCSYTLA